MGRSLIPFPEMNREEACKAGDLLLLRATDCHLSFLKNLYAEWQLPEWGLLPWADDQKRRMSSDQFELQHNEWLTQHPDADYWIIADPDERAQGRLYLDRSTAPWRLIDILLCEASRRAGIGSSLIQWIQHEAAAAGASITLQVAANNPRAKSLYEQLGFVALPASEQGMHLPMQWSPLDRPK